MMGQSQIANDFLSEVSRFLSWLLSLHWGNVSQLCCIVSVGVLCCRSIRQEQHCRT